MVPEQRDIGRPALMFTLLISCVSFGSRAQKNVRACSHPDRQTDRHTTRPCRGELRPKRLTSQITYRRIAQHDRKYSRRQSFGEVYEETNAKLLSVHIVLSCCQQPVFLAQGKAKLAALDGNTTARVAREFLVPAKKTVPNYTGKQAH